MASKTCSIWAQAGLPTLEYEVVPENEPVRSTRLGGLLTVTLTPELYALPAELNASDAKRYVPLGTVVVFQLHNHP